MADEQDKWLDRETAERLLRGEPLEAVDPCARDQAERLSRALGALAAEAGPAAGELPGEEAALAAFRKAREAADAERTPADLAARAPGRRSGTPADGADAGLIRIGGAGRTGTGARRPRWARPARFALAATLAVGTLGGVAVAAGSGVLPTPFDDEPPGPAVTVSAGTSGEPLASPSPGTPSGTAPGTPGGSAVGTPGGASDEAAAPDEDPGASDVPGPGAPPSASSGTGWDGVAAACRDLRDGREPAAVRKRALEHLAGGSGRVSRYCKVVLAAGEHPGGATGGKDGPDAGGQDDGDRGKGGGKDRDKGKDGEDRDGQGGDDDSHPGRRGGEHGDGGGGRHRRGAVPAPSAFAPKAPGHPGGTSPTSVPSPTYSAL
ncbi:hypothetical protein [Streptomyces sp. NPDC001621]|uniref:hypothetical protein n=1 Tax=Streptomyces sp. NPDC001621 TaxID=3364594 RepID=UPI00368DCE31